MDSDATSNAAQPKPRRRWFHLTADRLVICLLGLEGFLLLSEQFRWFPKGWTVLIAVASVGMAVLLLSLWFVASLILRWRFQFSIRSLLALVVLVAIPCSWLAAEVRQAEQQRRAVEELMKSMGDVEHDYDFDNSDNWIPNAQPPGPVWLRNLLGDDFFTDVTVVSSVLPVNDVRLVNRSQGEFLSIVETTDAELVNLKGLTRLQTLDLTHTQVTDAGLVNLKDMSQLTTLNLEMAPITDAGFERLEGLSSLRWLRLKRTRVTDAAFDHIKGLTSLVLLDLDGTRITDAGLEHLKGMTALRDLGLEQTNVTDEGVKKLQQDLPDCDIRR